MTEILGDENHVTGVKIHNNQVGDDTTLDTDGVFVYVGNFPNSQIFNNLNITDQAGWIITNDQMETTIPGIYAIGDVRQKQLRQIWNMRPRFPHQTGRNKALGCRRY